MSQFLQLPKNMPLQAPAILKGILSKVVQPTRTFSDQLNKSTKQYLGTSKKLSTQQFKAFYKNKTEKRFIQEMKLADDLQHIIINKQFDKMKQKLTKYGKSESLHINRLLNEKIRPSIQLSNQQNSLRKTSTSIRFTNFSNHSNHHTRNPSCLKSSSPHQSSYFSQNSYNISQLIKQSQKPQSSVKYPQNDKSIKQLSSNAQNHHDRVVFVDRKYNTQFAIKFSTLIETQQIQKGKQNYKRFLDGYKVRNCLVNQVNTGIKRKKYHSNYEKESIQSVGIIEMNKLKKQKVKQYNPLRRNTKKKSFSQRQLPFSDNNKIDNIIDDKIDSKNNPITLLKPHTKTTHLNNAQVKQNLIKQHPSLLNSSLIKFKQKNNIQISKLYRRKKQILFHQINQNRKSCI